MLLAPCNMATSALMRVGTLTEWFAVSEHDVLVSLPSPTAQCLQYISPHPKHRDSGSTVEPEHVQSSFDRGFQLMLTNCVPHSGDSGTV